MTQSNHLYSLIQYIYFFLTRLFISRKETNQTAFKFCPTPIFIMALRWGEWDTIKSCVIFLNSNYISISSSLVDLFISRKETNQTEFKFCHTPIFITALHCGEWDIHARPFLLSFLPAFLVCGSPYVHAGAKRCTESPEIDSCNHTTEPVCIPMHTLFCSMLVIHAICVAFSDVLSGDALQEVNFWMAMDRAIQHIDTQRKSKEFGLFSRYTRDIHYSILLRPCHPFDPWTQFGWFCL
jgi:hypothetical protein